MKWVRFSSGGQTAYGSLSNDTITEISGEPWADAKPSGRTHRLADVKLEIVDAGDGKSGMEVKVIDRVSVDEKEFYDFDLKRLRPKGFGVQIGTYQELVNLMRLTDNLKNSYQKKVTVQVKVINGIKYYSLIVGKFGSRDKADRFLASVKQKYPDAFIAEYDKMR